MKVTGSLQQRNNIYHAIVRVTATDGTTKQISQTTKVQVRGKSKRESDANFRKANKVLQQIILEYEKREAIASDRLFVVWIDEWLARKKTDVRTITYEAYEHFSRNHIKPYFKPLGLTIDKVTPRIIQKYVDKKVKEGLSSASIKKHMVVLNGVFETAIDFGDIAINPCSRVKLPKARRKEGHAYSPEQAIKLLASIEGASIEPAVMLALFLGLRRSEALGLRWKDVDFENNVVRVRNTVVKMYTIVEDEQTKSRASKRDLYLMPVLREYLQRWRGRQEQMKALYGKQYADDGGEVVHICTWPDGRPLSPDYLTRAFPNFLKKNGLPRITFHELRHTCGSLLVNAGRNIKEVQEYLGHEDVSTTLGIYTHLSAKSKIDAGDCLNDMLRK